MNKNKKYKNLTAFISSLGGGGAQGVFVTVMNAYASMGVDITVVVDELSNDVYSESLDSRIKIIELGAESARQSLPKLLKFIRRNRIEVAFAFSPEFAVNLYFCKRVLCRRFTIIARCINTLSYEYQYAEEFFRRHITQRLIKLFYKKTDLVIAQAENMRRDLIENYGFRSGQVVTINNPLASKYENREILEIRENYILFVGRLEKQKGLEMLIEAFAKLQNKDIQLYIIGKGSKSKKDVLIKKCIGLSLAERVKFFEYSGEIEKYYEKAKCTVLSSIFEGFPNVLIESIACGTPVVSYDLPSGPADIIIDGVNGYLAKYLDIDDLTACMDKTLINKWDYNHVKETSDKFLRKSIIPKYVDLLDRYVVYRDQQ